MKRNNETPPANNQEALNRACERLIDNLEVPRSTLQPERGDGIGCAYRSSRGVEDNCCVVGYMIPDWHFLDRYNSKMIGVLIENLPEVKAWFKEVSLELLTDLQTVHDTEAYWTNRQTMCEALRKVAAWHSLQIPEKYFDATEQPVPAEG